MSQQARGVSGPFGYLLQYTTARLSRYSVWRSRCSKRSLLSLVDTVLHGFSAGGGFCYQLQVRFGAGQQADAFAQERMIVCYQDTNRHQASLFGAVSRKRRPSLAHQPLLAENFSYAMRAGTVNSASVPAPASLQIFKRAPVLWARSCMPGMPQCPVRAPSFRKLGSIPYHRRVSVAGTCRGCIGFLPRSGLRARAGRHCARLRGRSDRSRP